MLLLFLGTLAAIVYGIYRATRRWGLSVLWCVAASACALDATGVIAERLWGPYYSWNFGHHGWHSLPGTLVMFCWNVIMALHYRRRSASY